MKPTKEIKESGVEPSLVAFGLSSDVMNPSFSSLSSALSKLFSSTVSLPICFLNKFKSVRRSDFHLFPKLSNNILTMSSLITEKESSSPPIRVS
ncbi:hypothetical protein AKJ56_00445 [candidate division MSBL1 archaeon SCGC-AAA382N08]|uniref:Uncharacterized protein n=1 Tax=candidate division MSBL1 archaeon SCGC-AAA382N08 TaxID=1698285 RepID=A0A133VQK6_9EURY|nr:hypothetical protein AKJ56_00445 [candidate division MSBL1 archaeon SCGC-AAA382N08]